MEHDRLEISRGMYPYLAHSPAMFTIWVMAFSLSVGAVSARR